MAGKRRSPAAVLEERDGIHHHHQQQSPLPGAKRHSTHDIDIDDNDIDNDEKENRMSAPSKSTQSKSKSKSSSNTTTTTTTTTSSSSSSVAMMNCINAPGKPPEAGVIVKVYAENFMCHKKLTVDLCRNVNFIHGQNGSGKSAILAAVQICLGAGARRTHRARNLKDLVRKEGNAHYAKVRVTLLNQGDDGFQREVYGDSITVERTISLHGGYNGYKLLDQHGKEQSRKKADLDDLLDQLNIQVENPVAVLDQEEAKKFLTGKPQDKYNFFMKATELERIDRTYASVVDNITHLKTTNDRVLQTVQASADAVKVLKHEFEQFQQMDKMVVKLQEHRIDLSWCVYKDTQQKVDAQTHILQTLSTKRDKRQHELEQAQSLSQNDDTKEQQLQQDMKDLTDEARQAARTKKELETELKMALGPQKAKRRELQQVRHEESRAVRKCNDAKRHLQQVRDDCLQASGSAESEQRERTQKLQEAEQQLQDERSKVQPQKQAIHTAFQQYEEQEPLEQQAKSDTEAARRQLLAVNHKIKELSSSNSNNNNNNSMALFGQRCARVHSLVQKHKSQFQGPVVGPIGAFIKMAPNKEHLTELAELALGGNGTLDKFILTHPSDRQLFQTLRQKAGCHPRECGAYTVQPSPRYKVPPPPVEHMDTIASALKIDDDLVFNTLVDFCKIDENALSTDMFDSQTQLLQEHPNDNGKFSVVGRHIKKCWCLPQGDRWEVKGGVKMIVSNTRRLTRTIGVDQTEALEAAQQEASVFQTALEEKLQHEQSVTAARRKLKQEWNVANKTSRTTNQTISELEAAIDDLKVEMEQAEGATELDTTELEEDVTNAERLVESLQEQAETVQQELKDLEPAVEDLKGQLEEVTSRNEKVLRELEEAEAKLEEYFQNLTQRQGEVERKLEKLEKLEEHLRVQSEQMEALQKARDEDLYRSRLLEYKHQREKNGGNKKDDDNNDNEDDDDNNEDGDDNHDNSIHNDPTEEELEAIEPRKLRREKNYYEAKIERGLAKIREEKERRRLTAGDSNVAWEKYQRALSELKSKNDQIENINQNIEFLTQDLKERKKRWRQFRNHIQHMTNNTFDEMLNKKGSSGELEFKHDEGTLDLIVQKDNQDESSQSRDVKALSGGERSFTTLALLLALGENLETPFRVMDEFDVFLDPVARKIALDQLIVVAKEMEHRQFIFITPQDLSSVQTDPNLKIIRMKPPSRSGTAGGPSQQTLDFSQSQAGE